MEGSKHGEDGREDLKRLKAAADLVEIMRLHDVELRPVGQNWVGRCVFHKDSKGSLTVNPQAAEYPQWQCFGCKRGGDVLRFLELKGMPFPGAVAWLRQHLNLPANGHAVYAVAAPAPPAASPDHLSGGFTRPQLLGEVARTYAHDLFEPKGAAARQYLECRGLGDPELWKAFDIGFCNGDLLRTVPRSGEMRPALAELGVISTKGWEHLRGRIVVPLRNAEGEVVGLYGRSIQPDAEVPHLYLKGPQRGVLNPPAFRTGEPLYVAESVLDALSIWQAGHRNVTALYGAGKLPPDVDALLQAERIPEVRLCLDADEAGRAGAQELAQGIAARGIRCVTIPLPEGQDPNALLAAQGPTALHQAIAKAAPATVLASLQPTPAPTADGFTLTLDGLTYRVTPRKPFSHGVKAFVEVTDGGKTVADTVNLETQRSRAALINQVIAAGMPVAKADVERHLLAILDAVRHWDETTRHTQPELATTTLVTKKAPPMAEADRELGLAFLHRPDLMQAVLEDVHFLGYVGEETNIAMVYLIGSSCKTDSPLSGIVLSQSAAGKSTLMEVLELLMPPEDVVFYSRLSPQALIWLPDDYVQHKVLAMEERIGGVEADHQIRLMQSKGFFKQAVALKDPHSGQMRTQEKELRGPMAYLETTTETHVNPENASRCFELVMDESAEQTRRIQRQQWNTRSLEALAQKRQREAIRTRHHMAQRMLAPIPVVIPYQHLITFPSQWPRCRRDNKRFISLVEVIAFLYQYQRDRRTLPADEYGGETVYIEATVDDYRLAYELARGVLGSTLHELTRNAQALWQEVYRFAAALTRGKGSVREVAFTRRDLRHAIRWPDHRLRDALEELVKMEYLSAVGSQGKQYTYQVLCDEACTPSPLSELTTPDVLEARWHAELQRS
ncbi:MAG: toprim domain-containing protein [Candidatus Xenobia bacterium]